MMGVRRTNDFISNATWTLAGIILVLSVASSMLTPDTVVKESNLTAPATEQKQAADFSTNAPVAKEEAPAAPAQPEATEAPAPAAETPAAEAPAAAQE